MGISDRITEQEVTEAFQETKILADGADVLLAAFPCQQHEKDLRVLKTCLKALNISMVLLGKEPFEINLKNP